MVGVILGMIVIIFVGLIVAQQFVTQAQDTKTITSSAEYNTTVDNIVTYTWLVFGFLALGIFIVGAIWIVRLVQSGFGGGVV